MCADGCDILLQHFFITSSYMKYRRSRHHALAGSCLSTLPHRYPCALFYHIILPSLTHVSTLYVDSKFSRLSLYDRPLIFIRRRRSWSLYSLLIIIHSSSCFLYLSLSDFYTPTAFFPSGIKIILRSNIAFRYYQRTFFFFLFLSFD